jgi:phenylacetate-CoA ligase
VAFWAAHYAAEKMGCEVVLPGGVLDTASRILKMQGLRASAMGAAPSYVLTMADTARNKMGIDPAKDLFIRRIVCAGEPGAGIPSTRKRMEEAWGAKVFDLSRACPARKARPGGLRTYGSIKNRCWMKARNTTKVHQR